MELDDIQPEDIYAYIDSSFIPELIVLTLIIFIISIMCEWTMPKNRLNMIDSRPVSLPIPLHLSHSRRGLTAKRFRRFTDMRNRRSKIFNLGRTFEQSSPSIVPTSKPEDVSFLCTRSGAKYYRPS
ncbi:uncharacterized protein isoform X2 [Rhodnius prolixus]|uniref:Uncharacterized protein n=1 Tax=Rhodnius prolixus TaxID=13249 RepID=T1I711_RHOPR